MSDPDPNATYPDNGLEPVAGECQACGTSQLAKSHVQAEDTVTDTAGKKVSGPIVVCTGCGAVQASKSKPKAKSKSKSKPKRKPAKKAATRRASTSSSTSKAKSSKGGKR